MATVTGSSTEAEVPGVRGDSTQYNGVLGVSTANGHSGVAGVHDEGVGNGVYGHSTGGDGVQGWTLADGHAGVAGVGQSPNSNGVYGRAEGAGAGVFGESAQYNGVVGISRANGHSGVAGVHDEGVGNGVYGRSKGGDGVQGFSLADGHAGVAGANDEAVGPGVYGRSKASDGVQGFSLADGHAGVIGVGQSSNSIGVYGRTDGAGVGVFGESVSGISILARGGALAGRFEGDVEVTGDIRLMNADCAEDFDIAGSETVEPGTVMVLGAEGNLKPSGQAYDKRVAGVISGAGNLRPGIVLDKQPAHRNRSPVALLGKVFCKVDAGYGSIEVGDLLTTSDTPGHAMKARDSSKAFGSVIGKALRPLTEGQGLIPVLIALQ